MWETDTSYARKVILYAHTRSWINCVTGRDCTTEKRTAADTKQMIDEAFSIYKQYNRLKFEERQILSRFYQKTFTSCTEYESYVQRTFSARTSFGKNHLGPRTWHMFTKFCMIKSRSFSVDYQRIYDPETVDYRFFSWRNKKNPHKMLVSLKRHYSLFIRLDHTDVSNSFHHFQEVLE